ncbi:hypothetical protein AD006_31445 (plasmid) [Pseudonocardia sp. EC080610-09]|nr:hypothetical protein AD006_31445 [Pseudonocardia sp. EC080610-09]
MTSRTRRAAATPAPPIALTRPTAPAARPPPTTRSRPAAPAQATIRRARAGSRTRAAPTTPTRTAPKPAASSPPTRAAVSSPRLRTTRHLPGMARVSSLVIRRAPRATGRSLLPVGPTLPPGIGWPSALLTGLAGCGPACRHRWRRCSV